MAKTKVIIEAIEKCESLEEYLEYIDTEQIDYDKSWKNELAALRLRCQVTLLHLSALTNIPYQSIKRLSSQAPIQSRNAAIKIIAVLSDSIDSAQALLNRYAFLPALYPKNEDDAIWIYLIHRYVTEQVPYEERYVQRDFDALKSIVDSLPTADTSVIPMTPQKTFVFNQELLSIQNARDFLEFFEKHRLQFRARNQKLIAFIKDAVKHNPNKSCRSATNLFDEKEYIYFRSKMRTIERGHTPDRSFLIFLGLKLNFCSQSLNLLLETAGLYRLNVKNRTESLIYFLLEEMSAIYPTALYDVESGKPLLDSSPPYFLKTQDQSETPLHLYFINHSCYDYVKMRLQPLPGDAMSHSKIFHH